jgi:hypothetical protein
MALSLAMWFLMYRRILVASSWESNRSKTNLLDLLDPDGEGTLNLSNTAVTTSNLMIFVTVQ